MIDDFLVRALLAGIGVAAVAGPCGCFVVWHRMAYFGDTLAHTALLGVGVGLLLGIDLTVGVLAVCGVVALLLVAVQREQRVAVDTQLGILAHAALALGLVGVSFAEGLRIDLLAYLFGDVLAVSWRDLIWVYGLAAVGLAALAALWRPLLALTVHEDLARAEGSRAGLARIALMLIVAAVVAVAMKVVGILLVTALLIIPAAAARPLARTPEAMAALAVLIGVLSVALGLAGSLGADTPAGPSIVLAATALLALSFSAAALMGRR